ncbi:MAG TPA: glucose 1-dehydrogenase [Bryobacteraceae bacterium]|nr:glucose 1-dehydrogenase [Bryobacteraceae bacterium]
MKAVAVFPDERRIAVIDHPEPKLGGAKQIKARVLDVGVCGTDKEIARFEYGTPPDGFKYLVIGHESLCEVVETGPEVTRVKKGDLVVLTVRRPCPEMCIACRAGRQDFCYTNDFTERGIKQQHGYMTELVTEDEQYAWPVPRELRDVAVLTEPLTIAEKGLEQLWQIQQRLPWACPTEAGSKGPGSCHHAVVLGAGPVGLLGAMALQLYGFSVTVYSRITPHDPGDEVVRAIGARFVNSNDVTVEEMARQVGQIDVVYEATGASRLSFDVIAQLGNNAVFIFTGVPGLHGPIEVPTDVIMRDMVLKNQLIFGTVNASPQAFENAIRSLGCFLQRWPDAVRKLITKRWPIEEAPELLTGKVEAIKNVVAIAS